LGRTDANKRVIRSVSPADHGTTIRIGLAGYSSANAGKVVKLKRTAPTKPITTIALKKHFMGDISFLLFFHVETNSGKLSRKTESFE
jgi:hypothetical protein